MGCVSSKVMTGSRSFQEEMSLSLQRRTTGVPVLEELLAGKNGGGDQFLALLCTANAVAAKLRAGNAAALEHQGKLPPPPAEREQAEKTITAANTASDDPAASLETINAWELMADLEQAEEEEEEEHPTRTAQSCSPRELAAVAASRSFRTVEDFDAMVAGEFHGLSSEKRPASNSSEHDQTGDARRGEDTKEGEEPAIAGNAAHEAADRAYGSRLSDTNVKPEHHPEALQGERADEGEGFPGNRSSAEPRGLRRKAMAKELKGLKVPSFEFSSVGSLREWLGGGGQVFSPGSYVTPKFGSFRSQAAGGGAAESEEDEGCEETLFDPQMVADLEEAMERLTREEEHVLRQIVVTLQGSP